MSRSGIIWSKLEAHTGVQHCVNTKFNVVLLVINYSNISNDVNAKAACNCEKTGLRGLRTGPTQTGLYSLRKRLEA